MLVLTATLMAIIRPQASAMALIVMTNRLVLRVMSSSPGLGRAVRPLKGRRPKAALLAVVHGRSQVTQIEQSKEALQLVPAGDRRRASLSCEVSSLGAGKRRGKLEVRRCRQWASEGEYRVEDPPHGGDHRLAGSQRRGRHGRWRWPELGKGGTDHC